MTLAVNDDVWVLTFWGPVYSKVVAVDVKGKACVTTPSGLLIVETSEVFHHAHDCYAAAAKRCFAKAECEMKEGLKWQEELTKLSKPERERRTSQS